MNLPQPLLVADRESLDACLQRCAHSDAIAVDTEFVRTDTFFPELGLIQLSDGDAVWLVDPLAIDDLSGLGNLLTDPGVVKVFHSCSEDLEVLRQRFGVIPQPLFDTQVAAAFLGHGHSRGYSALVESVLEIQLDKHETRSDWLQRPLTEAQQRYAAEDVYYLHKVYRRLVAGLEACGRSSWMEEEMIDLVAQAREPESPDTYYLRVKNAWKLSPTNLALLRELTRWREVEARERNRPRSRVVPDRAFIDLLRLRPSQSSGLYGIDGFHKGMIRRYGDKVLEILHSDPDVDGLEELQQPLDKEGRALLAHCRQALEARAEELGMAVELLARKKELEPLVRSALAGTPQLPPRLARGWRRELFGRELVDCVMCRRKTDE